MAKDKPKVEKRGMDRFELPSIAKQKTYVEAKRELMGRGNTFQQQ